MDTTDKRKFINACMDGSIGEVKRLHALGIAHNFRNDYPFVVACVHGHYQIAKWIYSLGNVNHNVDNDAPFFLTCRTGHLQVVKWLHSLGVDHNTYEDAPFRLACERGHLAIAKWLYSLGVNHNARNNTAFEWACTFGHEETVKWLYSLGGIDHNVVNDVFKRIYDYGMLVEHIAKWLITVGAIPNCDNKYYSYYQEVSTAATFILLWWKLHRAMRCI